MRTHWVDGTVNELCAKVRYELQSKDQVQHYGAVSSHYSPSAAASVYLDLIQKHMMGLQGAGIKKSLHILSSLWAASSPCLLHSNYGNTRVWVH